MHPSSSSSSSSFSGLKSISTLNISGNSFQGSVLGLFLENLEVIDLSKNLFQGHISQVQFNSKSYWSHLVYLDLSENMISGETFQNLSEFHNLKHLNLAHNRFSRQKFPQKIENLSGLEYLNLSKTGLVGHIPNEISKLSNLKALDISMNYLIGRIPSSLSISKSLKILDLSNNSLSGEIPPSLLEKLPLMEKYNFSYNNFTFCSSGVKPKILKTAFFGSLSSCPIAANPSLFQRRANERKGMKLALALTLSMICLLSGLLFVAFGCRRKTNSWEVKQGSYREEQNISGPFSFQTDSTTWVADVKQATSVPVVIFEKPLLNITFADLLSSTSNFDRDSTLLAEGKFEPVYRGFLPGNNILVAVKVLVVGSALTDQEAATELEYLGRIKHPNLVPLTGYCFAGDQRIVIYDYMENGNLQNLLHDLPIGVQRTYDMSTDTWEEEGDDENGIHQNLTPWPFRHKIALGTARALAFLHHGCSPPIIHRDVKASSVYLDYNLEPRLSDFGLAKIFGSGLDDEEIVHGSPRYAPPEFSQPEYDSPTPKSDVYSFGVVLFELISGKKPVEDDYPEDKDAATLVKWARELVRKNQASRAIDPKICDAKLNEMEEAP